MGQRLVITVKQNNEEIAKLYYHWGAYSSSSADQTSSLINFIENAREEDPDEDIKRILLRFVQSEGGGINGGDTKDSEEWIIAKTLFPDLELERDPNRNNGLISFTDQGMESLQYWSEGDVYVDLSERRVTNYVNWTYDSLEEVLKEIGREGEFNNDDTVTTGLDIADYSFDDADEVTNLCLEAESKNGFVCCGGQYYQMVY